MKYKRFYKKYKVIDERITDGYVDLKIVTEGGGHRWYKRYKLNWEVYFGPTKKDNNLHHIDFDK